MKGFVFWVAGTALVLLISFSIGGSSSSVTDMAFTRHEDDTGVMTGSRKLKEIGHTSSTDKSDRSGSVNLEDYEPIDPVPSSMTSIRPGPIQHGTPLMPYIPRPSPPPEHPKLVVGNGMLSSSPCKADAERPIRPFISAINGSDMYALRFYPSRRCQDDQPLCRMLLGSIPWSEYVNEIALLVIIDEAGPQTPCLSLIS